jgi:hypothetical protein
MKYRKKPIVIDAEQFFVESFTQARYLPEGVDYHHNIAQLQFPEHCFSIKTLEGSLRVSDGDWIIKGVKGEFYSIKDDIFKLTYERVDDASQI